MKELWTCDFVGRMHVEEVTQQELADEAGISKGYVCMILNNARNPKNGREMLENAFAAVLRRRHPGERTNNPRHGTAVPSGAEEAR